MERSNFAPHFCDTADGGNPFRTSGKWVTTKLAIGFRITRLRPSSLAVGLESAPHQLIGGLSQDLYGFIHSDWCEVSFAQ